MKKFIVEVTDSNVRVNGNLHTFECKMDKENHEDDIEMKGEICFL